MTGSVVLLVGGERFTCDRHILQQASPYFDAMFNLDMKEREAKEVEIHDIEPSVFTILMDFAYEKEVVINCENVIPLLRASSLFQFDAIQKKCCEYLLKHLNLENCISAWKLSDILGIQSLHSDAKKFILYEFPKLINGRDFLQLPLKLLIELLSYELLNCTSELDVFDSIVHWAEHNQVDDIINLLLCVRYKSLTQEEFEIIKNHGRIHKSSENKLFLHMLTNQLMKIPTHSYEHAFQKIFTLNTLEEKVTFAASNPPRKPLFSPLIIGRILDRENPVSIVRDASESSCLLLYTRDRFKKLKEPSVIKCEFGASSKHFYSKGSLCGCVGCLVGNDLYIFGGEYKIGSGYWNNSVWKYNLLTSEWVNVGMMQNSRRHCLITVLKETVYLIGGYGRFRRRLISVETYNTKTGTWNLQAPIPNPIHSSVVVTFENKIYVFSTPAFCYDPNEDNWTKIPCKEIGFSSAFVYRNQIYAVTNQDPAVLLHFILPNFTFEEEFTFHTNITCGCTIGNIFYGFNNDMAIAFNLSNCSCNIENFHYVLNTEMCCSIPNYDDI